MIDRHHKAAKARSHPLNAAAAALLPPGYQHPCELPVLALMRWGLENALDIRPFPPNWPDAEALIAMIGRMATWDPPAVLRFLTNPENLPGREFYLPPEALTKVSESAEAALILIDALMNGLGASER